MPLTIILPFEEEDGEEIDVEIDISADGTIEVRGYDIENALTLNEMGYEVEDEPFEFYQAFTEGAEGGPVTALKNLLLHGVYDDDWADALADAIEEQGIEEYGPEFKAEKLFSILIEQQLKGKRDVEDLIVSVIGENRFKELLIERLKQEAGKHGFDGAYAHEVAQLLLPRLEEEPSIEASCYHAYGLESWESRLDCEYTLVVEGEKIGSWKRAIEKRIEDPIHFHSFSTDWEECDAAGHTIHQGLSDALYGFGLDEPGPEEDEVEEPDHPTPADDDFLADYGVLYIIYDTKWEQGKGSVRIGVEEEIVVAYDDLYEAKEAVWLSEAIISRDGEQEKYDIKLLRKKTDEELEEEEFRARQEPLFEEEVLDRPEWMDEWALLEEE